MNNKRIYALGFFDGVHLGHQKLLSQCKHLATEYDCGTAAITFDRHPKSLFRETPTVLISTVPDRELLLKRYGMEEVLVLPVREDTMSIPWQDFLGMLLEKGAAGFVCGDDFRFGHRNAGTPALLMKKAAQLGMGCDIIPAVTLDGTTVSSTHIRALLKNGEVEEAARFLGYPYTMRGKVRHGKGLGRTIGAPTLNLIPPDHQLIPAYGVYATRVTVDGREYGAVTNVGVRPTVDENGGVTVESHLIDVNAQLYGSDCRVEFLRRLRGETKFESLAALQEQIARDVASAKEMFEQ